MTVKGLLFSKDHEWISIEGTVAIIGITDYAQEQLGDGVNVPPENLVQLTGAIGAGVLSQRRMERSAA